MSFAVYSTGSLLRRAVHRIVEGERIMLNRIVGLILLGISLAGCNTMSGMGRDIERGGQELQQESREVQRKM
jgi:predicted small secreted protein